MIEKHTFVKIINGLKDYADNVSKLEDALNVVFDVNYMTRVMDNTLDALAQGFFTLEEILDLSTYKQTLDTITSMIYHFCFTGYFGDNKKELERFFVENPDTSEEVSYDCFSANDLYNIITMYRWPKNTTNILIRC